MRLKNNLKKILALTFAVVLMILPLSNVYAVTMDGLGSVTWLGSGNAQRNIPISYPTELLSGTTTNSRQAVNSTYDQHDYKVSLNIYDTDAMSFSGWNVTGNASGYTTGKFIPSTSPDFEFYLTPGVSVTSNTDSGLNVTTGQQWSIEPVFTPITHTVTYEAASIDNPDVPYTGGSVAPTSEVVTGGTLISSLVPVATNLSQYEFAYYLVEGDATHYTSLSEVPGKVLSDMTITAYFKPLWYDIKMLQAGSNGHIEAKINPSNATRVDFEPGSVDVSDTITFLANPVTQGYRLTGWNVNVTRTGSDTDLFDDPEGDESENAGESIDVVYIISDDFTEIEIYIEKTGESVTAYLEPEFIVNVEPIYEAIPTYRVSVESNNINLGTVDYSYNGNSMELPRTSAMISVVEDDSFSVYEGQLLNLLASPVGNGYFYGWIINGVFYNGLATNSIIVDEDMEIIGSFYLHTLPEPTTSAPTTTQPTTQAEPTTVATTESATESATEADITDATLPEAAPTEMTDELLPEDSGDDALPKTSGVPALLFYGLGSGLAGLGFVIKKKAK